jgi:hypothetical protein|tara:strand:- start:365 stop:1066 length:702 start_codon:yes stop_codon:yes gene_type:complete
MQQKDFRLGLFGRTYLDTIVYLDSFDSGETNKPTEVQKTVGGIFNILKANIPSTIKYCYQDSEVEAFIISEYESSTRSSIVHSLSKKPKPHIEQELLDWLHVAYIDDLSYPDILNNLNIKISLDFCTLDPRQQYLDIIEKSSLIFDSRERKNLYNGLNFKTPLILHDKHGCECIINGKVVSRGFTQPKDNIHVNGAGDIFAGIFILEYYNSNLDSAIESSSRITTSYLTRNEI